MLLNKWDKFRTIEVWDLRHHDKVVLINDSKINKQIPHYRIVFTKNKLRKDAQYYLSYKTIVKSKKEWHKAANGKQILRYAVPDSLLENFILDERAMIGIW